MRDAHPGTSLHLTSANLWVKVARYVYNSNSKLFTNSIAENRNTVCFEAIRSPNHITSQANNNLVFAKKTGVSKVWWVSLQSASMKADVPPHSMAGGVITLHITKSMCVFEMCPCFSRMCHTHAHSVCVQFNACKHFFPTIVLPPLYKNRQLKHIVMGVIQNINITILAFTEFNIYHDRLDNHIAWVPLHQLLS